jgi:SAM-dependent methyltransferase
LDGEIASYDGRTLIGYLDKYLTPKSRILEAGCGFGGWCEWLARRGHDPIGLEYHEDIVAMSHDFNPEAKVELGDVKTVNYPNESFDSYISLGVIEHFEDGPQEALSEAYRVLKPGAIAFITTPYLNPIRRLFSHPVRSAYLKLTDLRGRRSNFWEYRFTADELSSFVSKAGLNVVEVAVDDYDPEQTDRHIGLWADWFFLRDRDGIYELNQMGKAVHRLLRRFVPDAWYAGGILVVASKPG